MHKKQRNNARGLFIPRSVAREIPLATRPGQAIDVTITSGLQTTVGKMIFGRCNGEAA